MVLCLYRKVPQVLFENRLLVVYNSQSTVRKTEATLSASNAGHLLQIINHIGNRRAQKLNGETPTLTVAGNSYYA